MNQSEIRERLLHPLHPLLLIDIILVYALGVGIADYLGTIIDWNTALLGFVWVFSLQIGAGYLFDYFQDQDDRFSPRNLGQNLVEQTPLWVGLTFLAVLASMTIALIAAGSLNVASWVLMILLLIGALTSAVPPLQFARSSFRELIFSIGYASLIPALAFSLQADGLHRLVSMSTFPLTWLHFAILLAMRFPHYAQDQKANIPSLAVYLGWEQAMRWINIAILAAYFFLAIAMLMGLPTIIAMPAFLTLPLGLLEIWYLSRIAEGAKPNWKMLRWLSISLFGLTAYLLTLTFWIR
jgi:1,4-dihydroxy-2-naphthoate octaprenyltransferase